MSRLWRLAFGSAQKVQGEMEARAEPLPDIDESRRHLLAAQGRFFDAVSSVVEENDRLRAQAIARKSH